MVTPSGLNHAPRRVQRCSVKHTTWQHPIHKEIADIGLLSPHSLLFGPPNEQDDPHHCWPRRALGLPGHGVSSMGGELAEPGWASPCGERSTGEDANSTPPWDLQEDQDQDQGTEEDIGSTGRGQGSTGRGQDLGPSGPCTGRSSSGPSGLFTRRRRRLEDPKQGQAPSVPRLQTSYQARQTSQGPPPPPPPPPPTSSSSTTQSHPRLQACSRMRAVQWATQEHRVRWETRRGHPAHVPLWPVWRGRPRPEVTLLQKPPPAYEAQARGPPGRRHGHRAPRAHHQLRHHPDCTSHVYHRDPGRHPHVRGPDGMAP